MIYSDDKAQKLSSQFATYINKIKFVEEVRQNKTEEMLDILDAIKHYNMGLMQLKHSAPAPAPKASYAVGY